MVREKTKKQYIYAYDPVIKKRVVHVVINGWSISLVTGHKFRYNKKGRYLNYLRNRYYKKNFR